MDSFELAALRSSSLFPAASVEDAGSTESASTGEPPERAASEGACHHIGIDGSWLAVALALALAALLALLVALVLALVPVMALFLLLQRDFLPGLTRGSGK